VPCPGALARRQLGDQCAAKQAAERALVLAEQDRLILPFAMSGITGLLETLPRHQTAHAALLADILDVLHGASPASRRQSSLPPAEELSPGEPRVVRYLPTNSGDDNVRGEPAGPGLTPASRGSWSARWSQVGQYQRAWRRVPHAGYREFRRVGVSGSPARQQAHRPGELCALGGQLAGGPGRGRSE
jgi:hypothetical protein